MFVEAGYVVLAIVYRHFGISGGEPRGLPWPLQETEDFKSALDWLETRPASIRCGSGSGARVSAGIVTHVATYNLRVKACVAQATILDGHAWIRSLNRESGLFGAMSNFS
ncbi:CocE/NonD family hydrolase [Novosphingobium sp. G106]|uniref:CocE/NonD family hydrolase n=1 Tax=Novosphingobium sp. G106 TaxID=2849500 RepID=UPI0035C86AF8